MNTPRRKNREQQSNKTVITTIGNNLYKYIPISEKKNGNGETAEKYQKKAVETVRQFSKQNIIPQEQQPQQSPDLLTNFLETTPTTGIRQAEVYNQPDWTERTRERLAEKETNLATPFLMELQKPLNPMNILKGIKQSEEEKEQILKGEKTSWDILKEHYEPVIQGLQNKYDTFKNKYSTGIDNKFEYLRDFTSLAVSTLFTPISMAFATLEAEHTAGEPIANALMIPYNTAGALTGAIMNSLNFSENPQKNREWKEFFTEIVPIVALGVSGKIGKGKISKKIDVNSEKFKNIVTETVEEAVNSKFIPNKSEVITQLENLISKEESPQNLVNLTQLKNKLTNDKVRESDITALKELGLMDIKKPYEEPPITIGEQPKVPEQKIEVTQKAVENAINEYDTKLFDLENKYNTKQIDLKTFENEYNTLEKSRKQWQQRQKELTESPPEIKKVSAIGTKKKEITQPPYDYTNQEKPLSGEVREGEKPLQPKPNIKTGEETSPPSGILQTPAEETFGLIPPTELQYPEGFWKGKTEKEIIPEPKQEVKLQITGKESSKIPIGEQKRPVETQTERKPISMSPKDIKTPPNSNVAIVNFNDGTKSRLNVKDLEAIGEEFNNVKNISFGKAQTTKEGGINWNTFKEISVIPKEKLEFKTAKKRIISDEIYNKAKQNLKKPPETLGMGTGLEWGISKTKDLATIGLYHLENGLNNFRDWSGKMLEEMGEKVKPYLRKVWDTINQTEFKKQLQKEGYDLQTMGISGKTPKPEFKEWLKNKLAEDEKIGEVKRYEDYINEYANLPKSKRKKRGYIPSEIPIGKKESVTKGYNERTMTELERKMGLPEQLEANRQEFNLLRGRTVENIETIKSAENKLTDILATPENKNKYKQDLLSTKTGEVKNSVDVLTARMFAENELNNNLKELQSKGEKLTVKDIYENATEPVKLYVATRMLGTELGRAVQSFGIGADRLEVSIQKVTNLLNEAIKDFKITDLEKELETLKKQSKTIESTNRIEDIEKIINTKKIIETVKPLLKEVKLTTSEKIHAIGRFIYYNMILSNPLTDTANILGNASNIGFEIYKEAFGGSLKDYIKNIPSALKMAKEEAIKVGKYLEEGDKKMFEGVRLNLIPKSQRGKILSNIFLATRRLAMEDAFFKGFAKGLELPVRKKLMAKEFGTTLKEVNKLFEDIMLNPDLSNIRHKQAFKTLLDVEEFAKQVTFNTELTSKLGKGLQMVSEHPAGMLVMPFVRTPANLLKASLNTTPLKILEYISSKERTRYKELSPRDKALTKRRVVAGTVLYTGLTGLMATGTLELTGSGPENIDKKRMWESLGYKPYHIYLNIGGKKYGGSYQNINPINFILGGIANTMDYMKYDYKEADDKTKLLQKVSKAIFGIAENFTDQTFMSGVKRFMGALQEGTNKNFLDDLAITFSLPAITSAPRDISRMLQTSLKGEEQGIQYEAEGYSERVRRKIGMGLEKGLRPRINQFGQPIKWEYERFPLPITQVTDKKIVKLLLDNNKIIGIPNKNTLLAGQEMTENQYTEYLIERGNIINTELERIYEKIKNESSDVIDKVVDKITRKATEEAKDILEKRYNLTKPKEKNELKERIERIYPTKSKTKKFSEEI